MDKPEYEKISKRQATEKYFDMVYRLAMARTKDKTIAEDVCQDVFLRFLKSDKIFESEEHIKAWLIKVTVNCSKGVFTSSWFKKTVPLSQELTFTNPEMSDLFDQVKKLPKKYSTVIHLFYYEQQNRILVFQYNFLPLIGEGDKQTNHYLMSLDGHNLLKLFVYLKKIY